MEWEGTVGGVISELLLPSASHVNFCIGSWFVAARRVIPSTPLYPAHEVSHLVHADFLMQSLVTPLSLLLSFHTAVTLKGVCLCVV